MNEIYPSRRPVPRCVNRVAWVGLLLFALLALNARFLAPLSAQTTIAISNSSFESPPPSEFPDYTAGATDWTKTNSSIPAGTFEPGFSGTLPAAIGVGSQVGYADGFGGLQQVLTESFSANQLYTFSVYIGYRSDALPSAPQGTGRITLGYFASGTFTALSWQSVTVNRGDFDFVSGSYQATAGALGQPIALQLTNLDSYQVLFDQAALSFTPIPEPPVFAGVLGIAAFGVAWLRRRRAYGHPALQAAR